MIAQQTVAVLRPTVCKLFIHGACSEMKREAKFALLLSRFRNRGLKQNELSPPFFLLLWRLGFSVRPPLFMSLVPLCIIQTIYFLIPFVTIALGLSLAVRDNPVLAARTCTLFAQVLGASVGLGVWTAVGSRRRARHLGLPLWDDQEFFRQTDTNDSEWSI